MSVPTNPSRAERRYAASSSGARNACGVWTPASTVCVGAGACAPPGRGQQVGERHHGDRPAVLPGGRDRGREELDARERPGAVVDRHDVDLAGLDLRGQDPQRVGLRVVAGGAAAPRPARRARRGGADGRGHVVVLPGRHHEHHPVHARQRPARCAPTSPAPGRRAAAAGPCSARPRPGCPIRRRGSRRRRCGGGHGRECRRGTARPAAGVFTAVTRRNTGENSGVLGSARAAGRAR